MKIECVEPYVFEAPLLRPWKTHLGEVKSKDHLVVKVTTNDGLVGVGEISPGPAFSGETGDAEASVIKGQLAPVMLGEDPFNLETILSRMDRAIVGFHLAKSAIDFALFDLLGKALGVPAYRLLGGRYRDKVPLAWPIGQRSKKEMVQEAVTKVKEGYGAIKLKIGGPDPREDVDLVRAVREAIGDRIALRVDANQAYSPDVAVRTIRQMEKYDLQYVEQPVPRWDLPGMARVREAVATPIMADESVFSLHDAYAVISTGAADILNLKVGKVGGLLMAKKVAAVAEAAGILCMVGSMLELSIGTMAGAHIALSTRNVSYECELVCHLFYSLDIVKETPKIERGCLMVPDKPGLGLELDEEKLKEVARKYAGP